MLDIGGCYLASQLGLTASRIKGFSFGLSSFVFCMSPDSTFSPQSKQSKSETWDLKKIQRFLNSPVVSNTVAQTNLWGRAMIKQTEKQEMCLFCSTFFASSNLSFLSCELSHNFTSLRPPIIPNIYLIVDSHQTLGSVRRWWLEPSAARQSHRAAEPDIMEDIKIRAITKKSWCSQTREIVYNLSQSLENLSRVEKTSTGSSQCRGAGALLWAPPTLSRQSACIHDLILSSLPATHDHQWGLGGRWTNKPRASITAQLSLHHNRSVQRLLQYRCWPNPSVHILLHFPSIHQQDPEILRTPSLGGGTPIESGVGILPFIHDQHYLMIGLINL